MKKFIAFISMFIVVLILGYLQPVFFPAKPIEKNMEYGKPEVFHTALPYEKRVTTGYSSYIGNSIEDFVNSFGEPKEKQVTTMGYDIWLFENQPNNYIEVNVKNNKISAIKALNESDQTLPFKMNMSLSDVSDIMTIYSDFTFTYSNTNYNIELTEEDMNYRPLIAFDNDTFAILFFDTQNKCLMGIYYLDKETLLTVMPYQLIEGNVFPILPIDEVREENRIEGRQLIGVINLLRRHQELPAYGTMSDSQKNAQKLIDIFREKNEDILSNERMGLWYISNEEASATSPFYLTKGEFQKLVKLGKMEKNKAEGLYLEPVYDPIFSILFCFSNAKYVSILEKKEKKDISIALFETSMLILIQDYEKEILQTGESE